MTSDADVDSDHVEWKSVQTAREGSSVLYEGRLYVDQRGNDPLGVSDMTIIGLVEDQCRVADARVDVDTASQLDTSVSETTSYPTLVLHISDDDNEDPITFFSKQVDVRALDPSLVDHSMTTEVSVMLNIN